LVSRKELFTLKGQSNRYLTSFSPDGSRLLGTIPSSKPPGENAVWTVKVWDANNGKELASWDLQSSYRPLLSWVPDGVRVTAHQTSGKDGDPDYTWSFKIRDAMTGKERLPLQGSLGNGFSRGPFFSPDGTRLARIAGRERDLNVWDFTTG